MNNWEIISYQLTEFVKNVIFEDVEEIRLELAFAFLKKI